MKHDIAISEVGGLENLEKSTERFTVKLNKNIYSWEIFLRVNVNLALSELRSQLAYDVVN